MSRRLRRKWAPALLALATLVASPPIFESSARAQAAENAEAKAAWEKGRTLASQRRWEAAIDAFRDADVLEPKPQYKLDLARALVEARKLREASEVLDEIDASKAETSTSIRGAVSKLREKIDRSLGTVVITVTGGGPTVTIEIDGKPTKSGQKNRLDPGKHLLKAHSTGWVPVEMTLDLGEGKTESVPFKLERDPGAAVAGPVEEGESEPPPEAPEEEDDGGTLLPAAIAWGVGGVGFGVGAIFGIFAFNEADKAREACVENVCSPEAQDALSASKLNGGVSTAGFIIGGAGLATGIVLAIVFGSGDAEPEAETGQIHVSPWIGVEHIGLSGAF